MDINEKELWERLGKIEQKLSSICHTLDIFRKRFDTIDRDFENLRTNLEARIEKNRDEIQNLKETTAKHRMIIILITGAISTAIGFLIKSIPPF